MAGVTASTELSRMTPYTCQCWRMPERAKPIRPISQVNVTARRMSTYCERGAIVPPRTAPGGRGPLEHRDAPPHAPHDPAEHRHHLIAREADPHQRFDEVAVHAVEDDDGRGEPEGDPLDQHADPHPGPGRDAVGAPV